MSLQLFSSAARSYEKCKKIKPMNQEERQKMYASSRKSYQPPKSAGDKKFSPFNTVSRKARDSFLLRVTNEPNTQDNYQLNHSLTMRKSRRPTIDKASFKRMIGPVNQNNYAVQMPEDDERCRKAFSEISRTKPLTARQTHDWRKHHEHLDFQKQIDPKRTPKKKIFKTSKSTKESFEGIRITTESNFNNFKRFSLRPRAEKSHDFNSNTGHQYLRDVEEKQIEPFYDIASNNEQFFRKSMKAPKGQLRFHNYRDEIKTRKDRADPNWSQRLIYSPDYEPIDPKTDQTIDFQQMTNRCANEVHNKYPLRQNLKPYVPLNHGN